MLQQPWGRQTVPGPVLWILDEDKGKSFSDFSALLIVFYIILCNELSILLNAYQAHFIDLALLPSKSVHDPLRNTRRSSSDITLIHCNDATFSFCGILPSNTIYFSKAHSWRQSGIYCRSGEKGPRPQPHVTSRQEEPDWKVEMAAAVSGVWRWVTGLTSSMFHLHVGGVTSHTWVIFYFLHFDHLMLHRNRWMQECWYNVFYWVEWHISIHVWKEKGSTAAMFDITADQISL